MTTIELWPGGAPGSEAWTHEEAAFIDPASGGQRVRNVVRPTLTAFLPDPAVATGTGIIVAPGGGFHMLSMDNEGTDVAAWLNERGIAAFVLKYRLVDTGPTDADFQQAFIRLFTQLVDPDRTRDDVLDGVAPGIPELATADGLQAMRLVRARASEWGVERLGFMGFSAGAYVTTAVTLTGEASTRPDFIAPIYGGKVDAEITADAPPLFSMVCADDGLCLSGTIRLFQAWRAAGRPAELHVYGSGGHGFGISKLGKPVDTWPDRFADWLTAEGFLPT